MFSVILTSAHVVVGFRVPIVETGILLVQLIDSHSFSMVISMRVEEIRELTYVVRTVPPHPLVSIAVVFQLMLTSQQEPQSMWDCILPVEVGYHIHLYSPSKPKLLDKYKT